MDAMRDPVIDMEQYRAPDPNATSRQVIAAHAATSMIPFENRRVQRAADITGEDARRLTVLLGHIGEASRLLADGSAEYETALLYAASAILAWLDANETARAH